MDAEPDEPLGRIEPLTALFGAEVGARDISNGQLRQYLYLRSGSLTVDVGGEEWRLRPGSLLILPAGVACRSSASRDLRGMWIAASDSLLNSRLMPILGAPTPEYWMSYHVPQIIDYWAGPNKVKIRDQVQEELEMARQHLREGCTTAVFAYVYVVLLSDVRRVNFSGIPMSTSCNSKSDLIVVTGFRGLIEKHFREHLAVETYASMLGVSAARLTRTCRLMTKSSPLELLQERMFREARRDLMASDRSVADIAYGLGFEEPAYFSRRFKNMVGITPGDYRRRGHEIH
jgi:AraC family transcriptional activator of pobA